MASAPLYDREKIHCGGAGNVRRVIVEKNVEHLRRGRGRAAFAVTEERRVRVFNLSPLP